MAFGFNIDKSKNDDMVMMPDFAYASRDNQYDFSIQSSAGQTMYQYHDIVQKGWYLLEWLSRAFNSTVCGLDIGTTDVAYNSSNYTKFYHLVAESDDAEYRFIVPLDVGDRVGICKHTSGDNVYLSATYIPMK